VAIQVLNAVAWPVTVLIVVLIFVRPLKAVLSRVNSAKFRGLEATFEYGQASADQTPTSEESGLPSGPSAEGSGALVRERGLDFTRVGDTFWLGHDLMWTIDILLRGAQARDIRWGLALALHHAQAVGFRGDGVEIALERLSSLSRALHDDDWNAKRRNEFAVELRNITNRIGGVAKVSQRGFVPYPPGADARTRTLPD
jgi:hypothetical protein